MQDEVGKRDVNTSWQPHLAAEGGLTVCNLVLTLLFPKFKSIRWENQSLYDSLIRFNDKLVLAYLAY